MFLVDASPCSSVRGDSPKFKSSGSPFSPVREISSATFGNTDDLQANAVTSEKSPPSESESSFDHKDSHLLRKKRSQFLEFSHELLENAGVGAMSQMYAAFITTIIASPRSNPVHEPKRK